MADSEMVERVARAIFLCMIERTEFVGLDGSATWETGTNDKAKDRWCKTACAAIEAMREPTENMIVVELRKGRNAALDEVARLVDHHPFADDAGEDCRDSQGCCEALAAQIRALKL